METCLDSLPSELSFPRSIPQERAAIIEIYIHGFTDASILRCCAVVYVVTKQGELVSQGLLVSKVRLAKRDLMIPRLELVSCHMVCNLIHNKKVLSYLPVASFYALTNSTVCLQWINGQGNYKQFLLNRMKKINDQQIEWKYVPTHEIPADNADNAATKQQLQANKTWMNGPGWLSKPEKWPEQLQVTPSEKI